MAAGPFKCPKCERSFSMAAHLARHTSTIHAGKRGPRPGVRRGRGRRGRRGPGRPRGSGKMARMSASDGASRVLKEMQAYHSELTGRRATLEAQIAGIANALSVMGAVPAGRPVGGRRRGRPPGRRRGRPPGRPPARPVGRPVGSGGRAGSLRETIVRVLRQRSKPLSPRDIAEGVRRSGYRTTSKNLAKAVSNTLPEIDNVRKVGRGLYSA